MKACLRADGLDPEPGGLEDLVRRDPRDVEPLDIGAGRREDRNARLGETSDLDVVAVFVGHQDGVGTDAVPRIRSTRQGR